MKRTGKELNEFVKLLDVKAKGNAKVQTHWVEVLEVDWDAKTMTAKGLTDDLEFYDVLLGLGTNYRRPKVGSLCLIGLILNNEAAAFLIAAESVEEITWNVKDNELTISEAGFLIKKNNETLKKVLNSLIDEVNKIIVVQGTSINVVAMNTIKQRLNNVLT